MNKVILISSIFLLLVITTFIKNETKDIEEKIILNKETIKK